MFLKDLKSGRVILVLSLYLCHSSIWCLDNGLARTPPMGWLSWERFECNLNCHDDPDTCIGERLLMMQADAMVAEGYKDVGYEYITVDDCWPADSRDSQGRLQADPRRFPHGMKALADYIHSKGLKIGVYEDVGRHTCAGAPGSQNHLELDAQTFADWGIDMLKFDGCNVDQSFYKVGYPAMGRYLNQTGRHILYSCEWALYDRSHGATPNYTAVADTCNVFRVYGDIYDAWDSITHIVNWYGDDEGNFSRVAAPGSFNDADMLTLGNYGLSNDQERVMMGMWAVLASPLLMSVDLRKVRPSSKALLQNRRVLAISQDPLGVQGKRVITWQNKLISAWTRPVLPKGSVVVAILNFKDVGWPEKVSVSLTDLGMTFKGGYNVTEVFDGSHLGYFKASQKITSFVNPNGIQLMKATPVNNKLNYDFKRKDINK